MKNQFLVPGAWFLVIALFACAHAPAKSEPVGAVDAGADPETRTAAIAAAVANERHLALVHPVPVSVDSTEAFREAFRKKSELESKLSGASRADLEPEWVAFGFVAPSGSAPDAGVAADQVNEVAHGVLDEQVAGYYDEFEHRMHLPATMPTSVDLSGADPNLQGRIQEFLVAHELEHALQDQHFGFDRLTHLPAASEVRLCTNAVYEGDAMLAGLVHLANQLGVSPARLMEITDKQLSKGKLSGTGKQLESAPPVLRERLLFPYSAGLHLAIALYRTGGWPLVDALFTHPPQTEAQLLHPEKYVAGVAAVPVATPPVPPGQRAVASGSLGELGAKTLLLGPHGHRNLAVGWAGDAFLVSAPAGSKQMSLQWVSTWETELQARGVAALLRMASRNWMDGPKEPKGWTISGRARITADGKTVVLVRGLDDATAAQLEPAQLALVGTRPPDAPPLGKLTLVEPPRTGEILPDGAYGSEPWSLYVPTPSGFRALAEPDEAPGVMLMVVRAQPLVAGTFATLGMPFSKALADRTFASAGRREKDAKRVDEGEIEAVGAHGWQSTLLTDGHTVQTIVVPACSGAQTFVFQLMWTHPEDEKPIRAWLDTFVNKPDAPACAH